MGSDKRKRNSDCEGNDNSNFVRFEIFLIYKGKTGIVWKDILIRQFYNIQGF